MVKKCEDNCQRCSWGAGNCKCPPWYSKADCDGSCKMLLLDGRCLCNSIRDGQDCEYFEEDPKASGTTYLCTPAKPGQEIFVLYGNSGKKSVRKMFVAFVGDGVLYLSFKPEFTAQNISRKIQFSGFRKTFFLTREEAMAGRYISREWLLKELSEYKNLKTWNTKVCDPDTILRVLQVVENRVNGAPDIGPRQYGSKMLAAKNAALKFYIESLTRQIANEKENYSRAESLNRIMAMGFYKGMVTANDQTLRWLERMVKDG